VPLLGQSGGFRHRPLTCPNGGFRQVGNDPFPGYSSGALFDLAAIAACFDDSVKPLGILGAGIDLVIAAGPRQALRPDRNLRGGTPAAARPCSADLSVADHVEVPLERTVFHVRELGAFASAPRTPKCLRDRQGDP
jgi:hypothetical protein